MRKTTTMVLIVIGMLLMCNIVNAETNVTMNVVSDENVNNEQTITSGGDVVSEHYLSGEGNIDLIINGAEWNPEEVSESFSALESEIQKSNSKAFSGNKVSQYIDRAVSLIMGHRENSNPVAESIAGSLYSVFMPRHEIAQMYEDLDARLAVWEEWAHLYDHERYCHAKAMVAQERGYKDFHCHDDEWYHIEPDYTEGIRVEPFDEE